jgi:protein disulfide-isomerase A1
VYDDQERETYVAEIRPLARKYEEYLHFVTTDANEYPDAAEMMGLKPGSSGLAVQNPNNGDIFPYTRRERITASTLEAFLADIIQGKVKAWRAGNAERDEL